MTHIKLASTSMEIADSQNATQIAYADVQKPRSGGKARKDAVRRIEKIASRLSDAAAQLEDLLDDNLTEQVTDDVHEALGRIMETQRLMATAHARLRRAAAQ